MTLARWMDVFGVDAAIIGDIVERSTGRSRRWVCRQVAAAIALSAVRDVRSRPWHAVVALLIGWGSVLLFFTMGDRIATAPGKIIWNWTVAHGYDGFRVWWFGGTSPGHAFLPVSYFGFALSGWIVSRATKPSSSLAYAASVFIIVAAIQVGFEYLNRPIIVPHTLFFVFAPSLRQMWRTGLVLLPMAVLLGGTIGARRATR
jgi:hypothetical protein